tara:strand:+ start:501 stop:854 length:354 start_codon:yes stop_codon:yes gene_type:complete
MNEYFKSLFNLNPMNLFGPNTGVNVDNMTMAQKRSLYGSMFDPMEAGRERLRAMTASDAAAGAAGGAGAVNPLLALSAMQGLLGPQQPQMMPIIQQQAVPGLRIPMSSMNNFYGGLL